MKLDKPMGRLFKVLVAGGTSKLAGAGARGAAGASFDAKTAERIVIPQHTTWGAF